MGLAAAADWALNNVCSHPTIAPVLLGREGVNRVCLLEGPMPGQVTERAFLLACPGSTPVFIPKTFAGTGLPEPVHSCSHSAFPVRW